MGGRRNGRRALGVAVVALAAGAAPAGAATVNLDTLPCTSDRGGCPSPYQLLEVRDTGGEANDLAFARDQTGIVVTDARTPLTAGRGCQSLSPDQVRCAATPDVVRTTIDAGAGDDVVDGGGLSFGTTGGLLEGGPGNDVLWGSVGSEELSGGGGTDRLDGRGGDDRLRDGDRSGEAGPDVLEGGPGLDLVLYETRTIGVTADLVAGGPAGEPGEGDTLAGLERVVGGSGDDVLRAPGSGAGLSDFGTAFGEAGNDRVAGSGRLVGGSGDDVVEGGPGPDLIEGSGGRDRLLGGAGDDVVTEGDTVPVFPAPGPPADGDVLEGGDGRDVVSYAGRSTAVVVDLALGRGGAPGESDVLAGFEDVLGGGGGDVLAGDGADNRLVAWGAIGGVTTTPDLTALDTLIGRAGDDTLEGGEGPDRFVAGSGDDTIRPGNAGDTTESTACGPGSDLVDRPDPRDVLLACERAELDQPLGDGTPGMALLRLPHPVLGPGRRFRLGVRCVPCAPRLEVRFLDALNRTVRRTRVRMRSGRPLVLRAPRRARLVRLYYASPRVGIDTGLRLRLPAPPSAQ